MNEDIVKIKNILKDYKGIYFVEKHGSNEFYIGYNGKLPLYWIVNRNGKFIINQFKSDISFENLILGINKDNLFSKLDICKEIPQFINNFIQNYV